LRPYLNKVATPERKGRCSTEIIPLLPKGVDRDFLAFLLRTNRVMFAAMADKTGSRMPRANMKALFSLRVAVPNDEVEQRKIATRLKAQLAEVDKARQAAEAQLRDTDALLVSIQRDIDKELFSKSETRPFCSYVKSYRNGFGKRPKEGECGPIVLRIADVSSGVISVANPRHGEVSEKEAETYKLEKNDLLFIRVNGAKEIVGKCCVVDDTVPEGTIFNDHLIRVQITEELNPDFARLCVSLPRTRQFIEEIASTSAGQLTINQQLLDRLEIPVYSADEQKEAVKKLQAQLDQLAVLRESTSNTINDINDLPQKILAQTFEM